MIPTLSISFACNSTYNLDDSVITLKSGNDLHIYIARKYFSISISMVSYGAMTIISKP